MLLPDVAIALPQEALWALAAGAVGLVFALVTAKKVMAADRGNERMIEIQDNIAVGAMAFLKREYRALSIFVLGVAIILAVALQKEGIESLGPLTAVAFVVGALCSSICGFGGMKIATAANARTTQAATRSFNEALGVAFPGGVVMGMLVMCVGVLGLTGLFYLFTSMAGNVGDAATIIAGFSMGASSIALFARVGGGIYTKAADVGADLVGKVEAGIPEDDPRNPAVIADNVGDNVGDVAGMGADLFESFVGALLGSIVIALATFSEEKVQTAAVGFVFASIAAGVLASIIGVFAVQVKEGGDPQAALRKGTIVSAVLFAVLIFLIANLIFGGIDGADTMKWAIAMAVGLACGMGIGFTAEHYTSGKVVEELAEQSDNTATNVIAGIAIGFKSAIPALLIIAVAVLAGYLLAGMYGVTLAAVGMLGTLGITVGVDAYGPIADNAGGIAEMAHLPPEVRERTDALDSAGNTTAAIAKGFAIGSAALTALALFVAYSAALTELGWDLSLNILDPVVLVGLFIGGVVPFMFSADTMNAVGRAAGAVIKEVQRQFREVPGLKEGKPEAKADYAKCVDITTASALKEMIRPGILAVVIPVAVGCFLGPNALGGLLAGSLVAGVPLAIMLANAGGAWDNAKKHIEKTGGKGTERHKSAVVGDTVGDPFKDTSGPSINILLKLMAVISLVFAPLIVTVFEMMPWFDTFK
ncbi:MAG: sodium-translocating pyrophosphatase [Planctomycetota bacterium]|nr:sodium-translocating pyrophosphatase [Planctomycetota bacterium]